MDLSAHFPLMLRDMDLTDLKHMMFSSYNLAKKEEEAESRQLLVWKSPFISNSFPRAKPD